MGRTSQVKRSTKETEIEVSLDLDGQGESEIDTGIPFLDHMLSQLSRHGYFDLKLKAKGDIQIDYHHTVEDTGIVLGEAFAKALGDKKGMPVSISLSPWPSRSRLTSISVSFVDRLTCEVLPISSLCSYRFFDIVF